MKVAFLAADMVEQVELTEPWEAVKDQGWDAELVSLRPGTIQGANHHDKGQTFPVDRTIDEVAGWTSMTPAERDRIMAELPSRQIASNQP